MTPAYRKAVAQVATKLRKRFESGELRGFTDDDCERPYNGEPGFVPPLFKLEGLCCRLYVTTMDRALEVLKHATRTDTHSAGWTWTKRGGGGTSMQGAAAVVMARHVVLYARAQGWTKAVRGEIPRGNWRRLAA